MARLLKYVVLAALFAVMATGCRASRQGSAALDEAEESRPAMHSEVKARAYKTAGDYRDNVMVTLDASGALAAWPAPNEVDAASAPEPLAGGYLLDRRDVNPQSAFLDITYAEYAALPFTPSAAELEAHLISGSGVTEIIEIPLARRFALGHPEVCSEIIETRLGDCKTLYSKER